MFRRLTKCLLTRQEIEIFAQSIQQCSISHTCRSATTHIQIPDQHTSTVETTLSTPYKDLQENLSPCKLANVQQIVETKLRHPASTTLADLVQFSPDLQQLVALGVSLSDVEKHEGAPDLLANLKYFPHIHDMVTLLGDLGIEEIGGILSKCPLLLGEEVNAIRQRILYLNRKHFTRNQIAGIVTRHPKWLLEDIPEIDARLGSIQQIFKLSGQDLKTMTARSPRVILSNILKLKQFAFTMKEVYGLERNQIAELMKNGPSVSLTANHRLKNRLDFLTEKMDITMAQIIAWPSVLRTRERILEERHHLLKHIGLAQYDPAMPGYISLQKLVSGKDTIFCTDVAQIPLEQYYAYVKTL